MKKHPGQISRREFLKNSSASAFTLGAMMLSRPLSALAAPADKKLRVALVGTGIRGSTTWGMNLKRDCRDLVEIVGLCDINPKRVEVARSWIKANIPTFTDFDQMIRTIKPESVIVTTVDAYHAYYVTRAMELGCNVLSEKPLCTEAEQAQAIIDTCKRTGRKLDVTFNARYEKSSMKLKEVLLAKEIGDIYSVYYDEFLDLDHGASYFRRWHGLKECSGTLLCHKSSHHFDELNWWIDADPVEVMAYGALNKYGKNGPFRHANCRLCVHKNKCELYYDITKDKSFMELYVGCESEDGYYRDGCLYRREINIYDTMSVQIKYSNKVQVTYTLNATVPYEGQFIVFNGSNGRIELRNYNSQPWEVPHSSELRLTRNFKDSVVIPLDVQADEFFEHGGADRRIKDMLFRPDQQDPLGQRAGLRAGILSSGIGISAYTSIERKERMKIADLINLG
ncbi:MAG TPA: Gfo/Idh/MocA family oxidoreductase [archaeon]|nr:Gfo/Idh/MocA family oxidoreductase [archaeon]